MRSPVDADRLHRAISCALESLETRRLLTTFTITSAVDDGTDGSAITLREAITMANANSGPDDIHFAIPGSGVRTITPQTALPEITGPVTIDGYTQSDSSPNTLATGNNAVLLIELSGATAGGSFDSAGLVLSGGASTVRGLVVNRWAGAGIRFQTLGNNVVVGCYIGTDPAGSAALLNGVGVRIAGSSDTEVGRPAPADRNVISGNGRGINLSADFDNSIPASNRVRIRNNYIGTNRSGNAAVPNGNAIDCNFCEDLTVGGPVATDGNVLSGNTGYWIQTLGSTRVLVQHNRIGTDATGTLPLGNGNSSFIDGANDEIDWTFFDNVISNNTGPGITFTVSGARVRNARIERNFIGTDITGTVSMPNTGPGVDIGGLDNVVAHNVIANNLGGGIAVAASTFFGSGFRIRLSENSIFNNVGPGISLAANANHNQAAPTVTDASPSSIAGTLASTPNHQYRIELFSTPAATAADAEGKTFLGFVTVTTNAAGNATFSFTSITPVTPGDFVTATAIDQTAGTNIGDTSAFSNALQVGAASDVYLSDLTPTFVQNGNGPLELDRSSGEQFANDGRPIRIGGIPHAKGLGVHARSELKYDLDNNYEVFRAAIGVDDEVGAGGTVVFQVFADGTRIFDSGRLTGSDVARNIVLNVAGVEELRLVVTDAGDGRNYDHADWADAKLTTVPKPPPPDERYLSDLTPISAVNGSGPYEKDRSNGERPLGDGRTLTINGVTFAKGLGVHAASELKYALNGLWRSFHAVIGLDDEVGPAGSAVFRVYGDGAQLFDSRRMRGTTPARDVHLNVTGVQVLRLVVTDSGDGKNYDHADWGDAKISMTPLASAARDAVPAEFVPMRRIENAFLLEELDPSIAPSHTRAGGIYYA